MAQVVISSAPKLPTQAPFIQTTKAITPTMEKIDNQLNPTGRKLVGEKALEKAMDSLTQMFNSRSISVSKVVDISNGFSSIQIQDNTTGKTIVSLPPEAAIRVAERAKEKSIGLIMDKSV